MVGQYWHVVKFRITKVNRFYQIAHIYLTNIFVPPPGLDTGVRAFKGFGASGAFWEPQKWSPTTQRATQCDHLASRVGVKIII